MTSPRKQALAAFMDALGAFLTPGTTLTWQEWDTLLRLRDAMLAEAANEGADNVRNLLRQALGESQ